MIETKEIREWLQANLVDDDFEFAIFSDVAEFKKAYKDEYSNDAIHYVNAIIDPDVPTILPIKNLQVATQSVTVHFVFDIDILSKDANGNYIEVDNLKRVLSDFITAKNGLPFTLTNNSVSFEVTPQFSGLTDGLASQLSPIGNVLPVDMGITFTLVESGINSNNVSIKFNGEDLFYQSASITRTRMAETNVMGSGNATTTAIQSNSFNLHINSPLLSSTQHLVLLNDNLSGGQNKANVLQITTPYQTKTYIVTTGENTLSLEPAKNIGIAFDLVEIPVSIADFSNSSVWNGVEFLSTSDYACRWNIAPGKTLVVAVPDSNLLLVQENTTNSTMVFNYTILANGKAQRYLYYQGGTKVNI